MSVYSMSFEIVVCYGNSNKAEKKTGRIENHFMIAHTQEVEIFSLHA